MSPKTKKQRRTQREKLADEVARTHRALTAYEPRVAPGPDQRQLDAFEAFSQALRALVDYRLASPCWEMTPGSWRWDGYELTFDFEYGGVADVTEPDKTPAYREVLQLSARLSLYPEADLDAELTRLSATCARYRDLVAGMERTAHGARAKHGEVTS